MYVPGDGNASHDGEGANTAEGGIKSVGECTGAAALRTRDGEGRMKWEWKRETRTRGSAMSTVEGEWFWVFT